MPREPWDQVARLEAELQSERVAQAALAETAEAAVRDRERHAAEVRATRRVTRNALRYYVGVHTVWIWTSHARDDKNRAVSAECRSFLHGFGVGLWAGGARHGGEGGAVHCGGGGARGGGGGAR